MINLLKWDSQFFNRKVGEVELNSNNITFLPLNDYELIYLKHSGHVELHIENFKHTLTDSRVVFKRTLKPCNSTIRDENISWVSSTDDKYILYDLAIESGRFSRFNLDPFIDKKDFTRLYKIWIDDSISQKISDGFLVYKIENRIKGFVTFKLESGFGLIGLLAVNFEERNLGIGRRLIKAVEMQLLKNDVNELRVETQTQNEIACQFYLKNEFRNFSFYQIEHFWRI